MTHLSENQLCHWWVSKWLQWHSSPQHHLQLKTFAAKQHVTERTGKWILMVGNECKALNFSRLYSSTIELNSMNQQATETFTQYFTIDDEQDGLPLDIVEMPRCSCCSSSRNLKPSLQCLVLQMQSTRDQTSLSPFCNLQSCLFYQLFSKSWALICLWFYCFIIYCFMLC